MNSNKPSNKVLDPDYIRKCERTTAGISLDVNECNQDSLELIHTRFGNVIRDIREQFLDEPSPLNIRISHFPDTPIQLNQIRSVHTGHLLNVDCVVRKISDIKQEVVVAGFRCKVCDTPYTQVFVDQSLRVPGLLSCHMQANHRGTYVDPMLCKYRDVQYVTVQEPAEGGRQPRSMLCVVSGDMLDYLTAGDRCRLTVAVHMRLDEDVPCMYLEAYDVVRADDDYRDIEVTEQDMQEIISTALKPTCRSLFVNSLAPLIYGYDSVKLALLLQIFGGVSREFPDGSRQRGDSHILLCGDPSVAKSQLIRAAHNLVPRGVYTSGKSTSAAGLTAAATRDERDGKWVLEAGALVLSDGGECVIDEFDKMTDNDRSALHEAMEQQSISVNKAGLCTTLKCRCAVLAAANPRGGRFLDAIDPRDQIDLPPSLISRFDLIFTLIDKPDVDVDTNVSRYVVGTRSGAVSEHDLLSAAFMRKYITYARSISPVISEEAGNLFQEVYVRLRNDTETYITLRQLEALMRLSEASARMRLSNVVEVADAKCAINLFMESLKSLTLKGTIDTGVIEGTPRVVMSMQDIICDMLKRGPMAATTVFDELNKTMTVPLEDVNSLLVSLWDSHKIEIRDTICSLTE